MDINLGFGMTVIAMSFGWNLFFCKYRLSADVTVPCLASLHPRSAEVPFSCFPLSPLQYFLFLLVLPSERILYDYFALIS